MGERDWKERETIRGYMKVQQKEETSNYMRMLYSFNITMIAEGGMRQRGKRLEI